MKDRHVVSDRYRELLAYNGFDSFESLWSLDLDWFEAPNYRRNGWSGVSRHVLKRPEGGCCAVFIKRQQNHNFKSLLHPVTGLPTTYREYRNICRMKKHKIPCPDLVFYGHRSGLGQWQAILITRAMDGYRPLEDSLNVLEKDDVRARTALLASVAETISRMHAHYLRHSCLYAKHILVRSNDTDEASQFDSVVIDLEKMRTGFVLSRFAAHDLDQLYRHWRRREGDWDTFVGNYLAQMKSGLSGRMLRDAVIRRGASETGRRSPVSEVAFGAEAAAQVEAATATVSA